MSESLQLFRSFKIDTAYLCSAASSIHQIRERTVNASLSEQGDESSVKGRQKLGKEATAHELGVDSGLSYL